MHKSQPIGLLIIVMLLAARSSQVGYSDYATPTGLPHTEGGVYPMPATAGRPAPYPGETVFPTFDPTKGAAMEQTNVAAATANTALRLETDTAEAAARPTSASAPTVTPPAALMKDVINSKPNCVPGQAFTSCHDDVLMIGFEYPSSWGEINAQFFTGGDSGHGYEYYFSVGKSGLQAGGRSADFAQGREKMLTDFAGFEPGPEAVQATCKQYGAMICDDVQPNVVLMMRFPAAEFVCDPAPGVEFLTTGIVGINLPARPKITGFVLTAGILSEPLRNELNATLGFSNKTNYTKCIDAAARQQFDAKVKQIVDAIQAGTVDPGTQASIDQLMHIAQSIRFD